MAASVGHSAGREEEAKQAVAAVGEAAAQVEPPWLLNLCSVGVHLLRDTSSVFDLVEVLADDAGAAEHAEKDIDAAVAINVVALTNDVAQLRHW